MIERPALVPALADAAPDIAAGDQAGPGAARDHLRTHLAQWRADTAATRARLEELRQQIDAGSRQLENPRAAYEYIDFFGTVLDRAREDLDAVLHAMPDALGPGHADLLRQIAATAAAEQRRTVMFRDKWVNKPLPYEQMRPVLTQLASEVRDQLADYKDLVLAAAKLTELLPPPAPLEPDPPPASEERGFDRRALFTKLIRPLGDDGPGGSGS